MTSFPTVFGAAPYTVRMAADVGLTRGALRELVKQASVRRVLRGVYVDSTVPDSVELRARALSLVVPAGVVVCLRSAAWLWGVELLAMGAHLTSPPIDLIGPAGSAASRRSAAAGRTGRLAHRDVVELFGVPVTTPVRTAADVARLLARPDALASLDALLRLPGLCADAVLDAVEAFGGYRGVVQARELTPLADCRSESPMESRTRLRAIDAGFPPFEPQVTVFDPLGAFVARLDLGRREEHKAVEYDGDAAHASLAQQRHDRSRRAGVERCGWGVAVVTGEHVLGRGLAFEHGIAELLGREFRLSRNHPRHGGWDPPGWAAA